jgi:hypothetical protein
VAGNNMNRRKHEPAGRHPVADYLAAVTARLTGPTAARVAIVDELHDGLLETLAAHRARGCSLQDAAQAAITEFGDPRMVGAGFAPELGAVQARRVALGLLVTGPLVGLTWIAAAAVAGLAVVVADLTLLAIITGQALTIPGSHTWAPVIVAAGASLTRVTLAGWAARRCLGIRAALTR